MVPLWITIALIFTACDKDGGSSPSTPAPTPSDPSSEDETPALPDVPVPPPDPTGPPSENTLNAAKFMLAPCASPLTFELPAKMKVGADVLVVRTEGTKKTLALNGTDLWEAIPVAGTTFAFDLDVKALGAEALYPSYLCNNVVTSYPDDANPDDQRGTVEIDANGTTATVTWHTKRANDKDLVQKIEVALPGGGAPVIFEGQ